MPKNFKRFHFKLLFSLLIVIFFACVTKKALPAKQKTPEKASVKIPEIPRNVSSIYTLEARYKNLNSIHAKASVDIDMPDFNQSVNSQIRWIRDSVFWMNFTILGIEGARLLITKDSFYMVDRINKKYIAENLSKLSVKYNLPISFKTLQNFFLGNPVFLSNNEVHLEKTNLVNHFIQEDNIWKGDYYTDSSTSILNKLNLKEKNGESTLSQNLQNYKSIKSLSSFSFDRLIEFYSKASGKASIKLEIKDLGINTPKEIKFSIPSSYERM